MALPMTPEQFQRRKEIKAAHDLLHWSFTKIGQYFGITRQRAYQLYNYREYEAQQPRVIEIMFDGKIKRLLRRY